MSDKKDKFVLEGTEAIGIYTRYTPSYKKIAGDNGEWQLVEICPTDKVEERINHLLAEATMEREFDHKPVIVIDREEYIKFKEEVETVWKKV